MSEVLSYHEFMEAMDAVNPKAVKKKFKDKAFARGVNRDDVIRGAEEIGVELEQHIQNTIAAMAEIAEEIGLAGDVAQVANAG